MAEAVVIPVRFVGDAGDGVAQITDDLDKLKAAAAGAGDQAAEGFDKAEQSLDALASAITAADVASEKLNNAASSGEIEAAALDAAVAVGKLKEEITKAAAAGQDTKKAVAAMGELNQAAKAAADRMGEIEAEATSLEKAIRKANAAASGLEGATGMRQLSRGSREATMAMVDLKEEIEKVRESGGKVDDAAVQALENVESAALRAKTKLAVVGDEMGDMGTKATIAAKGLEAVASSSGSMDAMMAKLKDTGTPFQQKIADISFGVTALTGAFAVGTAAGEKLRKLLDEWKGTGFLNYSDQLAEILTKLSAIDQRQGEKPKQGFWAALKSEAKDYAVAIGLVSASEDEYNAKLDKKLLKAEAHNIAMEASRKALDDSLTALKKLNPEIDAGVNLYAKASAELKAWNGYLDLATAKKEDLKAFFDSNNEQLRKLHQNLIDGKVPIELWGTTLKAAFERAGLASTQAGILGVAVRSFAKDLEAIKGSMTPLTTDQGQMVTKALSDVSMKLKDFYGEGMRFTTMGVRVKDSLGVATDAIQAIGVQGLIAKGDMAKFREEINKNIDSFVTLGIAAQKSGLEGMKQFREKVLDLLPAYQASKIAGEVYADSVKESNKALLDGADALEQQRAGMVAAREQGHLVELQNEANALAGNSWGDSLDNVAEKVVDLNKAAGKNIAQMAVGTPMYFAVARATREQADELKRLIELQGEWLKTQTGVLDKAPGWTDYLVGLKKGFDSGVTSLQTYLTSLDQFGSQIRRLFSGGGAGAQKAITEINNMIEAMKKAAMMGGFVENGLQSLDQLGAYANRMFEDVGSAESEFLGKSSGRWSDYFSKIDAARAKSNEEWAKTREEAAKQAAEQEETIKNVSAGIVEISEGTGRWVVKMAEATDGTRSIRREWEDLRKATEDGDVSESATEQLGYWTYSLQEVANGIRVVRKEWREMQEEIKKGTDDIKENLGPGYTGTRPNGGGGGGANSNFNNMGS